MIKNKLECVYLKSKFAQHQELKETLLDLIDHAPYRSPIIEKAEVNITKTDWFDSNNFERPWFNYIKESFTKHVFEMYKEMNFGKYKINEIWFQQYLENSEHGWHTHSANFTQVYYVELPKDAPKTLLMEPFTGNKIELDVEEGDVVLFPSFVLHKTMPNNSSQRKTIISFNVDAIYTDDIYGKGVK
jgi:hypothetical protein